MDGSQTRPTHPWFWLVLALGAAMVVVDQVTKLWAVSALTGRAPVAVVGELIQLRLTYNSGAAFSFAGGFTWLLTLISAAAVLVIGILASRVRS